MPTITKIPDTFWALFRSRNRLLYMEALLNLNDEYQYNNYFLSLEVCIQVLDSFFSDQKRNLEDEEAEPEAERLMPPAARTLNWLIRQGWLVRQEDFSRGITNIIIPDYAAIFLNAFERLYRDDEDEADVYIRNVYASVFSYMHDAREDLSLLKSALQNTKILNKTIQNMLHNMNRFFSSLLEQESYGSLLEEHLNGYVEEVVQKKYKILKTSDNFYLYKNDIKKWLLEIEESVAEKAAALGTEEEDSPLLRRCQAERELVHEISRGFDDIEKRIFYLDQEHMKYVRATTVRLNYLISEDRDTKGLIIRFLNQISGDGGEKAQEALAAAAGRMHLNGLTVMSQKLFYKKRKAKVSFASELEPEETAEELSKEDILRMNKTHNKYSRKQIEDFLDQGMHDGCFPVTEKTVTCDEDFEKLILAYDYALRRDSRYQVLAEEESRIKAGPYHYPKMTFQRRPNNP
ncbi:MAG: DUF5716 family protein [Eubacteriales bacterium]|nr:DUF5716 family protein [Eubacteriales bacterium]